MYSQRQSPLGKEKHLLFPWKTRWQAAALLPERKATERGGLAHRIFTATVAELSAVENWTSCEHNFILLG